MCDSFFLVWIHFFSQVESLPLRSGFGATLLLIYYSAKIFYVREFVLNMRYLLGQTSADKNKEPIGTIKAFWGDISKIPLGWHICDGTNGTPDLRDRFLAGAGYSYWLGYSAGEAIHTLTINEMPAHNHNISGIPRDRCDGNLGNAVVGDEIYYGTETWWTSVEGGNQPHENRPPFTAVYYIMRIF